MSDKKRITKENQDKKAIKSKTMKHLDASTMDLPAVYERQKRKTDIPKNPREKTLIPKNSPEITPIPTIPREMTPSPSNPPELCDNCKKCICRNWRGNLTPQFTVFFEDMLYAMKTSGMKNAPVANLEMEIELYPGTGVLLPKKKLMMAITQAQDNTRAMIRNILTGLFTEQELLTFDTAEKLYQAKPDVFLAISGYLKSNHNVEIKKSEFINVTNHKIGEWKLKNKLTEEELRKKVEQKRIKARIDRQNRKTNEKLSQQRPKKRKCYTLPSTSSTSMPHKTSSVAASSPSSYLISQSSADSVPLTSLDLESPPSKGLPQKTSSHAVTLSSSNFKPPLLSPSGAPTTYVQPSYAAPPFTHDNFQPPYSYPHPNFEVLDYSQQY